MLYEMIYAIAALWHCLYLIHLVQWFWFPVVQEYTPCLLLFAYVWISAVENLSGGLWKCCVSND